MANIKQAYQQAYSWFRYELRWSDRHTCDYRFPNKLEDRHSTELLKLSYSAIGAAYLTFTEDWYYSARRYEKNRFLKLLEEKRNYKFYKITTSKIISYGDPKWEPSDEWQATIQRMREKIKDRHSQ